MGLKSQVPVSSLKIGAMVTMIVIAIVTFGILAGYFYAERLGIKRELNNSMLRIALNLKVIESIRAGKATDAVDLLNTMNDTDLVYLKHYDDIESTNAEFVRRKKTVLATLSREWASHPRVSDGKDGSFKSDPEWQQYRRELENYLKQWDDFMGPQYGTSGSDSK